MAKTSKKKSRVKAKRKVHAPSWPMIVAVFFGTSCTALLSFVSMPLALGGFGLFTLAMVFYNSTRIRKEWESGAEKQMNIFSDSLFVQAEKVKHNRKDISVLQAAMRDLRETVDAIETPKSAAKPRIINAANFTQRQRVEPIDMVDSTAKEMPRAIKPGVKSLEPIDLEIERDEVPSELDHISDTVIREMLHNAMDQNRIDVFVQPIVRLPQRQTRFYEMFARIRAKPGLYIPAARYMKIAEQDNMDSRIDELLLLHCLKLIEKTAHLERPAPFFLNLARETLFNLHFMKKLLTFISGNRKLAQRLIFEISYKDFKSMTPQMREVFKGLAALGCSLSLDHVTGFNGLSIETLRDNHIRFIKMRADSVLKAADTLDNFRKLQRIKADFESNGIGVIIEKIESEEQMRELLDFDVRLGQGFLFGRPDLQGAYQKNNSRTRQTKHEANKAAS